MSHALHLRRILGPTIRLDASADNADPHPIWIQAAVEGVWKGHAAFDLIEFTEELFDQVIANFRRNPAYKVGDDGVGATRVIRLDYEHLSEMDLSESKTVAQDGLPAPGFVMELEKRRGGNGKVQLWALVLPNKKLWAQIDSGEYLWTSVAIDPKARDRETNNVIGPEMSSLAITNNPFILGMQEMSTDSTSLPVMATAKGENGYFLMTKSGSNQPILFAMSTYGEAESPDEVLVGLRTRFNLDPTATAAEVLLEVDVFRRLKKEGALPVHLQGDECRWLVSSIREMVGMKLLASEDEVFEEVRRILQPLVEKESNPDGGTPSAPGQSPPAEGGAAPSTENQQMSQKTLAERLAPTLKLSAGASDDDVVDAAKTRESQHKLFLSRVAKALGARIKLSDAEDEEKVVAAVEGAAGDAEKMEEAEEAVSAIKKVVDMFQAQDITEALSKATKLTDEVAKFGPMIEELNSLKAKMAEDEVAGVEEEVEKIAASHKTDERTKKLLLSQVIDEKEVDGKMVRTVNQKGLAQIRKDWALTEEEQKQKALLTSQVFAGSGGVQKGGAITGADNPAGTKPVQDPTATPLEETRKKIQLCQGRNEIEKSISFLAQNEKDRFAQVPLDKQPFVAGQFFKTGAFPAGF